MAQGEEVSQKEVDDTNIDIWYMDIYGAIVGIW